MKYLKQTQQTVEVAFENVIFGERKSGNDNKAKI
jgi:hypothetical protein